MILFKKIRWRNFLSTGNHFIEIDLTQEKTSLIIGTNGAGKSTILDALTFSLFNKPSSTTDIDQNPPPKMRSPKDHFKKIFFVLIVNII